MRNRKSFSKSQVVRDSNVLQTVLNKLDRGEVQAAWVRLEVVYDKEGVAIVR